MALPNCYSSAYEYFSDSVNFLRRYSWIYQHANTRVLRAGVFEQMPADFKDYFINVDNEELNRFPFVHEENELNGRIKSEELRAFRSELKRLAPEQKAHNKAHGTTPPNQANLNLSKMSPKKRHEIVELTQRISEICQPTTLLLDFGAGLGYQSALLHHLNPEWRILGLEAQAHCVAAAKERLQQQMPQASSSIVFRQYFISDNSSALEQEVRLSGLWPNDVPPHNWAIIGLHACADLSVTAIKCFLEIKGVRQLVIMPCCYHKLQMSAQAADQFDNFPLSAALKAAAACSSSDGCKIFNRPFLRLACQQTKARWQGCSAAEHASHGQQMFWRTLVDAIVCDETETPVALAKRNPRQPLGDAMTFKSLQSRFKLRAKTGNTRKQDEPELQWNEAHKQKFNEVSMRYATDTGARLAEGLTCLQMSMQGLCENLLLYDRLCYMEECAASRHDLKINVRFEKILNEKLSPRSYVLIAEKL